MKKLQKSDLKEGEIYKQLGYNYIFLYNKNETSNSFSDGTAISITSPRYCKRWSANGFEKDMIEATSEEKHWLETCIKADQFVSYEEAMKTFIPEYVECIEESVYDYGTNVIGKIYKVFGVTPNHINPDYLIEYSGIKHLSVSKHRFKPSTKEAYDAQFVVKKPEFVLPEKWWVRITKENLKDISKFLNANIGEYTIGFVAGMVKSYKTGKITKGYNLTPTTSYGSTFGNEITYDQFKKYALKENTTIIEKPKVVLEEPKDKVIQTTSSGGKIRIDKVQCAEGGVYKIGDKIKVFNKYSPNKGKPFTIKSFRWSKDKSKICAVTELHTPNGIGLDKIELYVETFKLPEKWAIKVNLQNVNIVGKWFNENSNTGIDDYNKTTVDKSRPMYNILHFPAFDYLGMLKHGAIDSKVEHNYTEITFEQFKKYVLKEENKPVLTENLTPSKNLCVEVPMPVKEESLLDKAKRLYPVGCKYKEYRGTVYTVNNQTFSQPEKNKIYGEKDKGCLFIRDEWAEIVEYPHGFKVGDRIQLKNSEQRITHIINEIEGNVLFYEANNNYLTNHCRILAKNAVKVK